VRAVRWLVLGLVVACSDIQAYHDIPIASSRTAWWAGGEITLVSAAFAGADTLPVILAASETLAVRWAGPDSVAVTLPMSASGTVGLEVHWADQSQTVVPVNVYGLLSAVEGPEVDGRLVSIAGLGNPTAIAIGSGGRLARVNLVSMHMVLLGGAVDTGYQICMAGVVANADDPSLVTLARYPGCRTEAVRLDNPLTVVDTGGQVATGYAAIYLGSGRWIRSLKSRLTITTGPGVTYDESCFGTFDFVTAPGPAAVTVPVQCNDASGVPVFDVVTAQRRYYLAAWRVDAAAFSGGGDTLYALAEYLNSYGYSLLKISAATGALLDSVSVPDPGARYWAHALALDPATPWLYLAGRVGDTGDVWVRVFDRRTLQQVGEMRASGDPVAGTMFFWSLIVGANRVLYLACNYSGYAPPRHPAILQWSLPPN